MFDQNQLNLSSWQALASCLKGNRTLEESKQIILVLVLFVFLMFVFVVSFFLYLF
jgi:hypothetical protein